MLNNVSLGEEERENEDRESKKEIVNARIFGKSDKLAYPIRPRKARSF